MTQESNIEARALMLLGRNIPITVVASTLGVEPSRISQMMSRNDFSQAVQETRFKDAAASASRDATIDSVEDMLLDRIKEAAPMLHKARDLFSAFNIINAAKRRSGINSDALTNSGAQVTTLIVHQRIVQNFTTNINNQVIKVGDQSLVTIGSGSLANKIREQQASAIYRLMKPPEQSIELAPLTLENGNDSARIEELSTRDPPEATAPGSTSSQAATLEVAGFPPLEESLYS